MPKRLFFAIGSDKQIRIIDAAMKEFSSHLYNEASINQIIQEADISRGSFYKYFEDKDDLYFFMIDQIIQTTAHAFLTSITRNPSIDVFFVNKSLFMFNLRLMSDEKHKAFFENLYLSMNYKIQQKLKIIFSKIRNELLEQQMNDIMTTSGYGKKHFLELVNILELINRDLLIMKIANHLDDQCVLEMYDLRLEVMHGGNLPESAEK